MQLQTNDTIFHNWKVNRVIGSGSFGTVYEIEREEFGHVYKAAAKVITIPDDSNDHFLLATEGMTEENTIFYYRSLVEDIIRECDVMEQMKGDSHIVSFEDHYVEELENGRRFIIYIRMELLKPLVSYITDKDSFLEREQIVRIGVDICKGLEVCQQKNVVHRDIKLENIFVSSTGKYKLGDFGISKVVEKSELAVSQKGTKLYMAPEMFRGEKYDARVDIYSLGLVLYRLLNNNRAPFMPAYPEKIHIQDKEKALQKRLSGEEFPNPCNADDALSAVVKKACHFIPKERYQTPKEMRMALEGLLSDSDDAYSLVNEPTDGQEHTSKTLYLQDVMGRLSVKQKKKKGNACVKKDHRWKFRIGISLLICIMLIVCGLGYWNRIMQNTNAICNIYQGSVVLDNLNDSVSQMVEETLIMAEQTFHGIWMQVPQVVGKEESEALQMLLAAGYHEEDVELSYEYNNEVVRGAVSYQNIEGGKQVRRGTGISIVVSKGAKVTFSAGKQAQSKKNRNDEAKDSSVQWKTLE
ncbi:MAG: serine/threonine protein kinase [Lachnospiraceae bacterium]|nr:serine/threonine protein kinase [Lachnospiraceae bacterium]